MFVFLLLFILFVLSCHSSPCYLYLSKFLFVVVVVGCCWCRVVGGGVGDCSLCLVDICSLLPVLLCVLLLFELFLVVFGSGCYCVVVCVLGIFCNIVRLDCLVRVLVRLCVRLRVFACFSCLLVCLFVCVWCFFCGDCCCLFVLCCVLYCCLMCVGCWVSCVVCCGLLVCYRAFGRVCVFVCVFVRLFVFVVGSFV